MPNNGIICVTVPKTFSLGGQTVTVSGRSISGNGWWTNDPEVCGDGDFNVLVTINAKPSAGTTLQSGTYAYPVTSTSAGYQNLSANLTIPQVGYYVHSYTLAQYSTSLVYKCDVSQPQNGYVAGDYRMCAVIPINNVNNHNPGSTKDYNSVFIIKDSFLDGVGDYIGPDTGQKTGIWIPTLPHYVARVSGGFGGSATKTYTAMQQGGTAAFPTWTPVTITEVALDTPYDFSGMNSIMVYSPSAVSDEQTPGALSITPTSVVMDTQTSTVGFQAFVTKSDGSVVEVTNLLATSWKSGDSSVLSLIPTGPYGCSYTPTGVPKIKCTQDFQLLNRPSSTTTVTVTANAYGYTATAQVTILPTPAAPKTINITASPLTPSFDSNSAGTTKSLTVTITSTGIPASYITHGSDSVINGSARDFIERNKFDESTLASTTDPITGNSTTTIQFNIKRNNNTPTTTATGTLNLTALGDGIPASITITITINAGTPTCLLSLTPTTTVKSFGTNQLPTTATFPFALNKTGTCGTITYTPVLQLDSQPSQPPRSWVTSTNTQSSYTATVALPQDAINYLPQMGAIYPLIGGVTATDVSGASTTALWATVIGKTASQPAISLDVAPLSGTAPLLITATATPSGFSSAPTTYAFSFGDGTTDIVNTNVDSHTYNPTATTTYTVLVVATNASGQSAWTNKIVTVYPSITKENKTLSLTIDPSIISLNRPAVGSPITASFNGTVSWNADLQSNATLSIPSWSGVPGGVTLSYVPANNCSGPSASSPCSVSFTMGNITNTTPAPTVFTIQASKNGVSTTSNPVTLSLTDVNNPLSASLSVAPSDGVGPLPVSATVSAANGTAPYTYSIDFGDGYSVSSASAAHVYGSVTATTTYTVTGKVTDAVKLSATATRSVTVYPNQQATVIPVTCTLTADKLMGLPPLRPTFTVTPGGGNSGSYVVKLDPTGTGSPLYNLPSPYTSNTYIFTISGSYASQATVQDANNLSNSATCQLTNGPLKVLSGSGGETNPGQ